MSESRARRARLEALQAELARETLDDGGATSAELQRLAEGLRALRERAAEVDRLSAQGEEFLHDALLDVRRLQRIEVTREHNRSARARGLSGRGLGIAFLAGAGLGASKVAAEVPLPVFVVFVVLVAALAGWFSWWRARLARAIVEAQRLL